jgi:hypothetical protein
MRPIQGGQIEMSALPVYQDSRVVAGATTMTKGANMRASSLPNFPNVKTALEPAVGHVLSAPGSVTFWVTAWAVGACLLSVPAMATAQGTSGIAGVVRDSSGAVLPGVTIEAASPALIEKIRTVVSDEKGEYKIVALPGGTYTVTFSLTGFTTVTREGLELTANYTANIVAEMRVGQLEETITVSGQAPIVDVQTTAQHKVIAGDLLYSLPLTKEMGGFAKVTVGATIRATAQDVGGNIDPMNGYTVIHGGHFGDNRALLDGMQFNGEGSGRGFYFNPAAASEISVQLGGQTAEFENGGAQANLIPKDGGNIFSGLFSMNYAGKGLISNNLTPDLRARGLKGVNTTDRTYDGNVAVGGPIQRDKLWFFASVRGFGYKNLMAADYWNLTQNTPFYTPDLSRPAPQQQDNRSAGVRFTYQVASKDKLSVSYDIQHTDLCLGCSPLIAPEATYTTHYANPNYLLQGKWTHLASNKMIWELADSTLIFNWPNHRKPVAANAISILNGSNGFRYNAPLASSLGQRVASESNQRGSISYVTGSHAFKVGFTTQEAWHHAWYDDNGPARGIGPGLVAYTFLNGPSGTVVPASITEFAEPVTFDERLKVNLGIYGQDQWTLKRLTLNLGIRYDYFNAFVPAQNLAAGPFVPARHYDQVNCVPCWKDINPRFAASYDLFGNGKTAVKVNVGRFVGADIYTMARANNPVTRAILSVSRTWTATHGNFTPDCDLTNPAFQDLSAVGGDICGAILNRNFGLNNPNAATYDPSVLLGYGARAYNWQKSVQVQHQLRRNIALTAGYFRTSWGAIQSTTNTAVSPSDFNSYCVTAPLDSRLPRGGGYPICGLYDPTRTAFGVSTTVVKRNDQLTEAYNGFDVAVDVRLPKGFNVNGGLNAGRTEFNNCALLNSPQIAFANASGTLAGAPGGTTAPLTPAYCDVVPPWSADTQVKFSGTIPLPYQFYTGITYQNLPGIPYYASAVFRNADIVPSLGRSLSQGANGTVTVDLIPPQTRFENRIQQIDLRFAKTFLVSAKHIEPEFDIYNALNASPILSVNNNYGTAAWRTPTQILAGRLLKFGVRMSF